MQPMKRLRMETSNLVFQPNTARVRLVKVGVVALHVIILAILLGIFIIAGMNWWILLGPVWWIVLVPSCLLLLTFPFVRIGIPFMRWSRQIRRSVYTVTREYVEVVADMGIFGHYSRQLPTAGVLSVTSHSTPVQRFCNLASITMTVASGESITFEDIADAENTRKAILHMVKQA